ncbi:PD-(D/E)XK nuclease family protein [Clostridium perfringens]|uniref:PD-(D/E)XK nuclease family protein n=1 Tax=Clostridium perfringens TaxID=1502 RepID=UPI000E4AEA37|nr:PD-(D/E)XK nuclease family protein [Clostridium perfringens]MBI6054291.1 PD-(D/E)XK nuclease family protein [Clostridium perfringens]MBO3328491.1 PD-(D/E)XK nuclease family protein [Clostridium perfringens]MDK0782999.1 PD-(D/E)XK nuclease family protein [Clostridium perfringens]MDM0560166.1 PD-(D/E)XK nuclease family protein [Clostridium perfringens]MDM0577565.1 PD-(D/E)XK nuclease family protein [Clostridium perfringens]
MNLIKLLGIETKEDIISNLIVGAINKSEVFRKNFLENICGINYLEYTDIKAYTRIQTLNGIPDIVIKLKSNLQDILVIIENKLKADEGYNQTKKYSSEKCISDLLKNPKINLKNKNIKTIFLFLTLIPEQVPSGEAFKNITYKDLISKVKVDIEDKFLDKLMKDFYSVVGEFYKNLDVDKNDRILDIINENNDSTKLYIKFKKVLELYNSSNGLKIYSSGKVSAKGRESCFVKIYKENWVGDLAEQINGFYQVSENTYNIHFEPSIGMNGIISIPLHYEINPYMGQSRLKENSKKEDYEKYILRRNEIKHMIHAEIRNLNDYDIKITGRCNQIAKIDFIIDENMTVKEFINKLTLYMDKLSDIVDRALLKVK